ncbi:hypothetical protein [Marinomonas flavescens]|uniref:hypothetical protein n=1 Tax=Marinomonas flavescens TaxID=2529379 RepID=UPI001055A7D1|nr:hypothetical protein [Marinomonas flavescens]
MKTTDQEKMKKILKWINPQDTEQSEWLESYLEKKKEVQSLNRLTIRALGISNLEDKINAFKIASYNWPDTLETMAFCNRMKAAWNQYKKRKNSKLISGEFTISKEAYNELKRLAKQSKVSQSKIIESFLLQLKKNRTDEQLMNRVNKPKPEAQRGIFQRKQRTKLTYNTSNENKKTS